MEPEFVDLLGSRQQIALDPGTERMNRIARGFEAATAHSCGDHEANSLSSIGQIWT